MHFRADTDTVARPSELLAEHWRDWCLCGDLDAGADRMRWRGETWLPKFHMEEQGQYNARRLGSDLFPGLSSALDRVVGGIFDQAVTVTTPGTDDKPGEPPAEFEPIIQNADGDGNDLTQTAKSFLRSAAKYGRAHMLIDYTKMAQDSPVTKADEQAKGPRPYWRVIEAPRLLGWKTFTLPNGQQAFSEIRIHELRTVPDGQWGEKRAEFIRVIRRDSYELWRNMAYTPPARADSLAPATDARHYDAKEDRPTDFTLVEQGTYGPPGGFESVPLVTLYTGYRGFMRATSPFMALAEVNLTHWQSASDHRNSLHIARIPIMFAKGFRAEEITSLVVSAGALVTSGNEAANLSYVEHSGSALGLSRDDLDDLQSRMEQLGVQPHVEKSANASATGVALSVKPSDSAVQAWAQACDTALEQCFQWSAIWMGKPELAKDIDVQTHKPDAMKLGQASDIPALQADVREGRISLPTYLKEAKRRGLLGDDVDIDAEAERAENEKAQRRQVALDIAKNTKPEPGGKLDGEQDEQDEQEDTDETEGGKPPQREAA